MTIQRRKTRLVLKPGATAPKAAEPASAAPAPSARVPDAVPEVPAQPPAAEANGSERAKALLLAHISHGFRTPLNAIIGFSEIMEREMFGKIGIPRYIEYVKDIRSSAQHLLRLIEDVVDVSKAESGALEMEDTDIDVAAAIRSVCLMQRERAAQAGVQFAQDVPEEFPRLRADRRRLRQILQNLLANAVRFTSRGGRVTVSARVEPGGGVAIAIADTGSGIEAKEIPHVFDPFPGIGRVQDVGGGGGTGLGLPLCKGLMELHGGTISLASQRGKGTTVTIVFPPERTVAEPATA
ncbi:MAG: HAMP domain-containing histidine kinase [Rhodospirillaceae bacterium]|nr:HAMP domain-containing histidine kinase [Rhodospirillaceae bacterium]